MMKYKHASDNVADRRLGKYWEQKFCEMAAKYGFMFTPLQIGRSESALAQKGERGIILPDITIWTMPGQHHEIKHKNPTRYGRFGLEKYRLDSLLTFSHETGQDVMYTIHNHDLSGGRNSKINNLDHWITANVLNLQDRQAHEFEGTTYYGGGSIKCKIYTWPVSMWMPLKDYWENWIPHDCRVQLQYIDEIPIENFSKYILSRNLSVDKCEWIGGEFVAIVSKKDE